MSVTANQPATMSMLVSSTPASGGWLLVALIDVLVEFGSGSSRKTSLLGFELVGSILFTLALSKGSSLVRHLRLRIRLCNLLPLASRRRGRDSREVIE